MPKQRTKHRFIILSFIGILITLIVWPHTENAAPTSPNQKATTISTTMPHLATIDILEPAIGRIKCRQAPVVTAETLGRVLSVHVEKGQAIHHEQLLLTLDDHNFQLEKDSAQAEINRLNALIQHSKQQVKRFQKMVEQKYVSEARLEAYQTELLAYQAQLSSAQSKLKLANHKISKSKIFSPIKGVIENRFVSPGDFVNIGSKVFKIAATDELLVELPFPKSYSKHLKPGMIVLLCDMPHCKDPIKAEINHVLPNIQSDSHNIYAIIELNQKENLTPGGAVYAQLILETKKNVLLIPKLSVVNRPQGSIVYIIKDNKAMARVVTLGTTHQSFIEILDGIKNTDVLALDGSGFLSDNTKIRISKSTA